MRARWQSLLADERKNAVLIGPGVGVGERTKSDGAGGARYSAAVVLDADAITSFAERSRQALRRNHRARDARGAHPA